MFLLWLVGMFLFAKSCALPVDIYLFDTKVDTNRLFQDFSFKSRRIVYDSELIYQIYKHTLYTCPSLSNLASDHGTNIAAILLEYTKNIEMSIYDVPISLPHNPKIASISLLQHAIYEVGQKIKQSRYYKQHTIFILSFSVPLKKVNSARTQDCLDKISALIRNLLKYNVHVFVAAGNEGISSDDSWPSCIEGVYSIGGLAVWFDFQKITIFHKHLYFQDYVSNTNASFYELSTNIPVTIRKKKRLVHGTSYSNALAAAKVANILSKIDRPIHSKTTMNQILKQLFIYDFKREHSMLPLEAC